MTEEYTPTPGAVRLTWIDYYHQISYGMDDPTESGKEFDRMIQAVEAAAEQRGAAPLLKLLQELVDPDDCWFDHNGGCQAHGFIFLEPGQTCPHQDAKELIRADQMEADDD